VLAITDSTEFGPGLSHAGGLGVGEWSAGAPERWRWAEIIDVRRDDPEPWTTRHPDDVDIDYVS
jgi:hypothetical protein